jgi:hypothetical protein
VRKKTEEEAPLELAVDPRALVEVRANRPQAVQSSSPSNAPLGRSASLVPLGVGDLAFDARLLADYGDPPRQTLLAPLYAWRVLRRQRELKQALVGRRAEAARAETEVQDALVALAERVRPVAEKLPSHVTVLQPLRRAEESLRSRDRVLAAEQDAQTARLASVDARLSGLESRLAQALEEERDLSADLASAQGALAREETKLKRAEAELRGAQQRETGGAGE